MVELKTPRHEFFGHIHLLRDFDDIETLGISDEIDEKTGRYKGKEIEALIDGHPAIVEIVDYYSEPFKNIKLLNSLFLIVYGMSSLEIKRLMHKKYNNINDKTPLLLVVYKLVEIA